MGAMASPITSITIFYSIVYSGTDKKTSKLRVTGPLCGEFTGDRWFPRTKGQLRGKCFHLMTSSWRARLLLFLSVWYVTHWDGVTDIYVSKLDHHWFRWKLVVSLAPSYFLNQWWLIVNEKTIQWHVKTNQTISLHKTNLKMPSEMCWPCCSGCNLFCQFSFKSLNSQLYSNFESNGCYTDNGLHSFQEP